MLSRKNKLIKIGAIMIVFQLISILSVSCAEVGLYPNNEHLRQDNYYYDYVHPAYFETDMIPVAVKAGLERFVSSYGKRHVKNEDGKILSPVQHKSAMYRAALYLTTQHYGGQGIYIYDSILTFSYSIVGITGLGLFIAGIAVERRKLKKNKQPLEDKDTTDFEIFSVNE